mgnify:CR=1 FL=1
MRKSGTFKFVYNVKNYNISKNFVVEGSVPVFKNEKGKNIQIGIADNIIVSGNLLVAEIHIDFPESIRDNVLAPTLFGVKNKDEIIEIEGVKAFKEERYLKEYYYNYD